MKQRTFVSAVRQAATRLLKSIQQHRFGSNNPIGLSSTSIVRTIV